MCYILEEMSSLGNGLYTAEDIGKAFNFFISMVVFFSHVAGGLHEVLTRAENRKCVLPVFTALPSPNLGNVERWEERDGTREGRVGRGMKGRMMV